MTKEKANKVAKILDDIDICNEKIEAIEMMADDYGVDHDNMFEDDEVKTMIKPFEDKIHQLEKELEEM